MTTGNSLLYKCNRDPRAPQIGTSEADDAMVLPRFLPNPFPAAIKPGLHLKYFVKQLKRAGGIM